jgi:hypothetical protein
MVFFGIVFVDTMSSHSGVLRGAERSLAHRWSDELGIDLHPGEAPSLEPVVDQMVRKLPLPPRAMQVVRGDDLRKLGNTEDIDASAAPGDAPYARRLGHLGREVRLFAVCNFVLFLATALLTFKRRSDALPCLLPAGVLVLSTLASSIVYLTARDWFWSFLADDHAGLGYLALVGLVVLSFVDILLNRARIVSLVLRFLSWLPA